MRIKQHTITRFSRILCFALGMFTTNAYAACTLNVQSVIFGSYNVFENTHLDGAGNVSVVCDVATSYTISLSPGNGTYTNRILLSGQNELVYNLFIDAARTLVWGDGTGSSSMVSALSTNSNHTIYGRIPARQNVHVGNYIDSITVTLVF